MKDSVFSFWWFSSQAHLEQIAEIKAPHLNCGKTVALTFIIPSMLPEIIYKMIFNVWKIKETPWKTLFYFILMNFHSSTPKTDCKNKKNRSKLWENSCFDIYNTIHVARNSASDTIQCISTQNHPKQITEIKTPYLNCRKTVFLILWQHAVCQKYLYVCLWSDFILFYFYFYYC